MLLVLVVLVPLRLALMTVAEVLAFAVCCLATAGHAKGTALSPLRRRLVDLVVPLCCRAVLLSSGFWRVRKCGRIPSARLCVANHVSIVDGFILYWLLGPDVAFVARAEDLAGLPLYGRILTALQTIFVDRRDSSSRRKANEAIALHCRVPGSRILLVFPEGSTSGDGKMLPFKLGAFRPLEPVGLVAIRYPSKAFPPAGSLLRELLTVAGLLTSLTNEVEVAFLGTLEPPPGGDPAHFAASARRVLQYTLGHEPDMLWPS